MIEETIDLLPVKWKPSRLASVRSKPGKRKMLVGALLALAVTGTHWLPGRTVSATPSDSSLEKSQIAVVTSDKGINGPNSLLGDTVMDKTSQSLASSADLTQYHLDADGVVDQAGMSRLLSSMAPASDEMASDADAQQISSVDASAVPEPRTAGFLLLAAVPVLIRRKGRVA